MPQLNIGSANITTFRFSVAWDLYQRKVTFTDMSTYSGSSGGGIYSVLGLSFQLEDQDGVVLTSIDFSDASKYIVPSVTNEFVVDLSSLSYPFLFQTYKITGAIKDGNGNVYTTVPVYKKICQPINFTESGYVPGVFQITANCPDNVLTIKEVTPFIYNNLTPFSAPTKTGTLSYPTGTISAVAFTGTPFSNNVIYTGEYRIVCTTVATYDLGDDVYVLVTYLTNNVFPVTCANKMSDLNCCIVELQTTARKECNNAVGKNAAQKIAEISMDFMVGLSKEINGQDASAEYTIIKQKLKCDCGASSIRQNEFTPINPAVTSIVITGVGGTTVPSPTINGNTKTYNIASNVYQVVKGNTGDLAFTIAIDTSTTYTVKYKITFNYTVMAGYILNAIAADATLIAQLNSLISSSGNIDLTGLDGKCIINLSANDYYMTQNVTASTLVTLITINGINHAVNIFASNPSGIQTLLNTLGLGTFSVSNSSNVFSILSVGNTNIVNSVTFTDPDTTVPFQSNNATLVSVLQAIIDYLCELTALQIALGRNLTLCYLDYNLNVVTISYPEDTKQDSFNAGVAYSICNIVARINTLTGITCAKMAALFVDSESSTFSSAARAYGNDGVNCVGFTPKQIALGVIAAIQSYSDVKDAFCAIDCEAPSTCPDVSNISLAMVGANIGVYGLTWATATLATQTVTVQYKLSSSSTWITATNSLQILANGNISGTTPFEISGIVAGSTYDVRIINNCGGLGFSKQITAPTGTVYSGSFLLDSILYTICGASPITLYSSAPFAAGVTMYTNVGLTTPVTGYHYIADNNDGSIFAINTSTGLVGADTGSACNNGTSGLYLLGNNTTTICSQTQQTLYTNGAFAVGGILYSDSGLTSPVTGSAYVLNSANGQIYNLNTSTGQIGATTGLGCATYAIASRASASSGTVCSAPLTTRYSSNFPAPGVTIYTDINMTTPMTGFSFYVYSSVVYTVNPISGVLGVASGDIC